jgi:hypothetical protein
MTHRGGRAIVLATFAIAAVLLWGARRDGPDFGHYFEWGLAALSGSIFELGGDMLSPGGVPFSLASAAPGMLFTTIHHATGQLLEFRTAAYLTGWAGATAFWASAFVALRAVARGSLTLVAFGLGALFVGTHAGFYSYTYSTEVFANALVAGIWAVAVSRIRHDVLAAVVAGSLAGLLLCVRPYLVLYAVPPLWLVMVPGAAAGRSPHGRTFVRLLAVATPLVLAALQAAVVNRWMTGSPLQPPYVYGGFGFESMNLLQPQIGAVLAHPWRGLLVYHPLYGIAALALLVRAWQGGPWRVVWVATVGVVLIHLWIQSAWHIWWLGASFGLRGLAPSALPLVLALVATVSHDVDRQGRAGLWWVRAGLLACAWSLPLLLKGNGSSLVWSELLAGQTLAAVAAGVLVLIWAAVAVCRVRYGMPRARTEVAHSGLVLLAASLGILVAQGLDGVDLALVLVAAAVAVGLFFVERLPGWERASTRLVCVAAVALFAVQTLFFARLAIRTERHLASGEPPPRPFRSVGSVPVDALHQNYLEYVNIPGFDERKRKLLAYLNWLEIEAARMPPVERDLSERVLRAMSDDPVAGALLVRVTASNGVVRLFSPADTNAAQRDRAVEIVRAVPGVVDVEADMK